MDHPTISIIIPVFNAERYLDEAIQSIYDQKYSPLEIIVIDDGSTDNSGNIGKYYPDIIVHQFRNSKGAAAARNKGIRMATGTLLAFLDADDIWIRNKLLLQYYEIKSDPQLDMIFGMTEQFISPELEKEPGSQRLREEFKEMPGYLMGSMLIKKESFLQVGFLNENLQLAEFIDWFERAREMGLKHKMLTDIVLRRRIHLTNQGITKRGHQKDYIKVLKAALERRRKMANDK
jgi:glycosyltransferase involved in cell wall biosynthesis